MRLRLVLMSVLVPLLVIAAAIVGARWAGDKVSADTRSAIDVGARLAARGHPGRGCHGLVEGPRAARRGLGVDRIGRAVLTDDAALRDLSTRSVIGQHTEELHDAYGWSPADLDWEAYGQAKDGAVMVAQLDGSVSLASVRSHLAKLGYSRDGRVWTIPPDGALSAPSWPRR